MTEEPQQLKDLSELLRATYDVQNSLTAMQDEIETAIEDAVKLLSVKSQEILAQCKNVLEANQIKIWNEGIGTILTRLDEIEATLKKATGETDKA